MEPAWYYVLDGKQVGPITFEDLKAVAASGELTPDDLVWQEGTADWVDAKTVPGLFTGPTPAAPPAPPARVRRSSSSGVGVTVAGFGAPTRRRNSIASAT